MGLNVGVGILRDLLDEDPEGAEWVEEDLRAVNSVLERNGVATFEEPSSGDWPVQSFDMGPTRRFITFGVSLRISGCETRFLDQATTRLLMIPYWRKHMSASARARQMCPSPT